MAIAKMEQYVNNSDCVKVKVDEVEAYFFGPGVLGRRREAFFKKCDKRRL